jgi:hypothetical protein
MLVGCTPSKPVTPESEVPQTVDEAPPKRAEPTAGAVEKSASAIALSGMIVPTRERPERTVSALGFSLRATRGAGWIELGVRTETSDDGGLDYLHCHALELRADSTFEQGSRQGEDAWWLPLASSHRIEEGREVVAASVWSGSLRHLVESEASGGKLCDDEFTLSADQKARVREFLDAVGPVTDGSTSAAVHIAPSSPFPSIGIPVCDEYISKYHLCVTTKIPEAARPQVMAALEQTVKVWQEAAMGPGRDSLEPGCAAALDAAKSATASMGCEW